MNDRTSPGLAGALAAAVISIVLVSGCADDKTVVNVPGTPSLATTSSEPVTLKMQSFVTASDILYEPFVDWATKVEELSGGRLRIETYPSGVVTSGATIVQAASAGILDGAHAVPVLLFGSHHAAGLFGSTPSYGLDAEGMLAWMRHGGGQELLDELLQQELKLNVVSVPYAPFPTQPLGWFGTGVSTTADLANLRYRTIGLSASLFNALGVSATSVPGPDIVPRIKAGLLDAAEFNNPTSDRTLGLHTVRSFYVLQGYHQPGEFLTLHFNKTKFESLPPDLQAIIRHAALAASADFTSRLMDQNSRDLAELRQLGIQVIRTTPAMLQDQLNAWDTVEATESASNLFFARVADSLKAYARRVTVYRDDVIVDPSLARNHYFGPP